MGRQSLNIHSRPHIGHDNTTTGDEQPEWVLHASAVLTAQTTDHNHLPNACAVASTRHSRDRGG
ncbi:hypothetical protein OIO89_00175 (plasmid) [Mycobacterium ulcerans]|nr:hypothetical protein OIO89_00175 [Mycobacterium ulcerans]